jgi:uridylate kinase
MTTSRYRRVVLKLSGEALAGEQGFGIAHSMLSSVAKQVSEVQELGVEMALVVGGGNIWRGLREAHRNGPCYRDYMGMLATVRMPWPYRMHWNNIISKRGFYQPLK